MTFEGFGTVCGLSSSCVAPGFNVTLALSPSSEIHTLLSQCSYVFNRHFWANSADPDRTAPKGAVLSGSSLFATF